MKWALGVLCGLLGVLAWHLVRGAPDEALPPSRFPTSFAVHGVDVSRHNGTIDWGRVADAGVHFAFVKATEGGDVRDARFEANVAGASAAGLRVGAYHFFTFCRPGVVQAQHFLSVVKGARLTLPPVVDVEFVGNCRQPPPPAEIRAQLEAWLAVVEAELGREVVLYTTDDADELVQGLSRPRWRRSVPGTPRTEWRFWQFDPSGRVPGIDGPVDLDVFGGSLDAL